MAFLLNALAAYAGVGVIVALAFAALGVTRVQPMAMSLGARILILPGAVALWPYLLTRWIKASRT
jgi:hypothetical protein